MQDGDLLNELGTQNIHLSDVDDPGSIGVLLGDDVMGKLHTGHQHVL